MATAAEKFMKTLKMKERGAIARRIGVGLSEMDSSYEDEFFAALLYTAKRRNNNVSFRWEDAEEMTADQLQDEMLKVFDELGFEDDEEPEDEQEAANLDGSE